MKRGIRKLCFIPTLIFVLVLFSLPAQAMIISDSLNFFPAGSPDCSYGDLWGGRLCGSTVPNGFIRLLPHKSDVAVEKLGHSGNSGGGSVYGNGSHPGTRVDTLAWAYPGNLKTGDFKPVPSRCLTEFIWPP